jgi:hypothetical protein
MIIHGIGDQAPFETMDAFLRPFSETLKTPIKKTHRLKQFSDWIESYVSLVPSDPAKPEIDIYEYYWAYMTERKITAREIGAWVIEVAKGAEKFYRRQKDANNQKERNDELFTKDNEFKNYEYLARIVSHGSFLKNLFKRLLSVPFWWFRWMLAVIVNKLKGPMEKVVGDIAVYCSTDKKSKFYDVRAKILKGSFEKLKFLVDKCDYDEILLIGHSLGSVVAYDTLARLNKECHVNEPLRQKCSKIKGLVTFGSPLDKIAFFFDEQIPKEQTIRSAIVSQLYGFKRAHVDSNAVESGLNQYFDNLKWLNFWTGTDPVSGHLDVYKDVNNIPMDFSKVIRNGIHKGLDSHCAYWKSKDMYARIIKEFAL